MNMNQHQHPNLRVKLVAVGGASCAGKSTLADRLQAVFASCSPHVHVFVLKQDTFFKPTDLIPIDPATGEANWEVPDALDFPAMAKVFDQIRTTQSLTQLNALWKEKALGRDAQDHMRTSDDFPSGVQPPEWCPPATQVEALLSSLPVDTVGNNHDSPQQLQQQQQQQQHVIVLVDGFLLFHDPLVLNLFDARLFLAADYSTCHKRRYARTGYACADGVFWQDPPGYFEQYVWPAYLEFNHAVLSSLPPAFSASTLSAADSSSQLQPQVLHPTGSIAWQITASFECGSTVDFLCIDSREHLASRQPLFREAVVKVMEHVLL